MSIWDENVAVFNDTEKMCYENEILAKSIKDSVKNQSIFLEDNESGYSFDVAHKYDEPAKIVVSKKRSFKAAEGYAGMKTCVHNFASASYPGGGVKTGQRAQEESLCRCSTLYFCLTDYKCRKQFYEPHGNAGNPVHNDDCIYTPDVIVFKSDTDKPELMQEKEWYKVDVITCAAPNLKYAQELLSNDELYNVHYRRMLRILDVASSKGAEVLITGAFGCGAFRNDPEVVAKAMKVAISERSHNFKVIELAVFCVPGRDEKNYEIFNRVITN